jgi:hypothetical protein
VIKSGEFEVTARLDLSENLIKKDHKKPSEEAIYTNLDMMRMSLDSQMLKDKQRGKGGRNKSTFERFHIDLSAVKSNGSDN